jgi:hypothetical protein
VVGEDMPVLQLMLGAVSEYTATPGLWRRYLYLLMDGLRAHSDNLVLPALRTDQPIFTGRPVPPAEPPSGPPAEPPSGTSSPTAGPGSR